MICLLPSFAEHSSFADDGSLRALADEYLIALTDMEEQVLGKYVFAATGEAFAAYENRAAPISRSEVFLSGANRTEQFEFFASGVTLGRIDEVGVRRAWDQTLKQGLTGYRRVAIENEDGQLLYRANPIPKREYPSFNPFALAVSTRMCWMAGLCGPSYVTRLATVKGTIRHAERGENGNLIGYWSVKSPQCVLKVEFDRKSNNLPVYSEWLILMGAKKYEDTMEKGWPECVTVIEWKKAGKSWVPHRIKKTDNGTLRRPMMEEWELQLVWYMGDEFDNMLPKHEDENWIAGFQRKDAFDEAWSLRGWKPLESSRVKQ